MEQALAAIHRRHIQKKGGCKASFFVVRYLEIQPRTRTYEYLTRIDSVRPFGLLGGALRFKGGHPARLLGSIGIASVRLTGVAKNLRSPSDIAGTYGAAGAGATFVGGGQVATLQNEKGVVLEVKGAQVGFQASLGVAGMQITMR